MSGRRLLVVAALAALASLLVTAPAMAGRLVATGHDADLHCSGSAKQQCHYVNVAVTWIRAAAPDPNKPVLVLDNGTEVGTALDNAFGPGAVPRTVVDPATPAFASTPLSPANFSA